MPPMSSTMMPVRIQLSRKRGFRLQEHGRSINGLESVKVDRSTKWGNPFNWASFYRPGHNTPEDARAEAVRMFRAAVIGFDSNGSWCAPVAHPDSTIGRIIAEAPVSLRGKNLACWCPSGPCHADVLLEIANA